MKTLLQVLEAIDKKQTWERGNCEVLDDRDYARLLPFLEVQEWSKLGFKVKDGAEVSPRVEWNEENVMKQFRSDLEFAIEKAEDRRGISASLMYDVVCMWLWIFEDDMPSRHSYTNYGLPLLREASEKYAVTA